MLSNPVRLFLSCVLLLSQWAGVRAEDEPNALERVQQQGTLEVAVYQDLPPYSFRKNGRVVGVDVDVARALAEKLGIAASIRAVGADENMEDDLRNNVWKGHYLGGGVADLMLHVPYDEEFAEENDRVLFLAPYFREQLVVAIGKNHGNRTATFELFTREKVGVELDTLADFYLLSAYGGQIRDQVVHFKNYTEAGAALKNGELAGVVGPRGEVEYVLGEDRLDFAVGPVQMPGLRQTGWDLGGAVKAGNEALAAALVEAMAVIRSDGTLVAIFEKYGITHQQPSQVSDGILGLEGEYDESDGKDG